MVLFPLNPNGVGIYAFVGMMEILEDFWPFWLGLLLAQWIFCHKSNNNRLKGLTLGICGGLSLVLLVLSAVLARGNPELFETLDLIPLWDGVICDTLALFFISLISLLPLGLGWLLSLITRALRKPAADNQKIPFVQREED